MGTYALPYINARACMRACSYVTHSIIVHEYEKTALLEHSFHMPCMHAQFIIYSNRTVTCTCKHAWIMGNAVGLNWMDSVKCMHACILAYIIIFSFMHGVE